MQQGKVGSAVETGADKAPRTDAERLEGHATLHFGGLENAGRRGYTVSDGFGFQDGRNRSAEAGRPHNDPLERGAHGWRRRYLRGNGRAREALSRLLISALCVRASARFL